MKIDILQKQLAKNNLDSVLLLNLGTIDPSVYYFAGIELEKAALLIKRSSAEVFVIKLEIWRAQKESRVKDVKEYKSIEDFAKELKGNVGINSAYISLSSAKKLQEQNIHLVSASELISKLREVKTEEEIRRIRKACSISDEIMESCISNFKQFRTERDAKVFLKKEAIDKNCDLAFPPIVASGRNAALPHYSGSGKLNKGFCVIDFGVKYKGYCSDTTRTIFIGKPSQKDKELYEKLLFCQTETEKAVKPGKSMEQLEQFSRSILGNLQKDFIHRLGHSVGVEVHDPLDKTTKLEPGMVVTIEPGVYFKGKLGIRVEDTVLITKNGCDALTKVSKELTVIS